MFSPPKLKTIIGSLAAVLALSSITSGQQAEYQRRMAAMQQARQRVQVNQSRDDQVRLASAESGIDYAAPPAPAPQRVAQGARSADARARTPQAPRRVTQAPQRVARVPSGNRPIQRTSSNSRTAGNYVPSHVRTAQLADDPVVSGGSPIISGSNVPMMAPGPTTMVPNGNPYETVIDGGYVDGGYVDGGYMDGGIIEGGDAGGCGSCGCCDTGCYTDCCDPCDPCCGRGGCPPGPCWWSGLGGVLRNGSYFMGAQGFENPIFQVPGTNTYIQDSDFGYYAGFNLGWPLCKLTCGVFSGQFGYRTVQSSFNGNQFTTGTRDQNFITAGLYRRVDYGLQAGVVVDYLKENWYATTETTQLRGDLGWVYPNGSAFGFRFGAFLQDDSNTNQIAEQQTQLVTYSQDWYKFYLRRENTQTGMGEFFLGWTSNKQAVLGLDFDVPIAEKFALQAGYTYFLNGDQVQQVNEQFGGNENDAWNVSVGLVFRPSGRCYYRSYDRPLFNVADNGSMMIIRGPFVPDNGDGDGDDGG